MRSPFKIVFPAMSMWAVSPLLLFLLTLGLARCGLPDYSHWHHPVALRGASGLPGGLLFNLGAFLLPGVCLLLAAQALRRPLQASGWWTRIGLTLCQLSVLAFALQGALPLDQRGVDEAASRLHVLMWMLWWIAFVPGALLLALGQRQRRGFALASVAAAALVPGIAVLAPIGLWVGLAQRLAFGLWFGWWWLAVAQLSRASVSGEESAPPARM